MKYIKQNDEWTGLISLLIPKKLNYLHRKSERENIKKEYPVIKIKELLPNTIV